MCSRRRLAGCGALAVVLLAGCGALVDEATFGGQCTGDSCQDMGEILRPADGGPQDDGCLPGAADCYFEQADSDGTEQEGGDGEGEGGDRDGGGDGEGEAGCMPECAGKQCGPDGCGGVCGYCPAPPGCGDVAFSPLVQKVTELAPGDGGTPGEALDVDGDPETCAPAANCQDGLDNQVAGIVSEVTSMFPTLGLSEMTAAMDSGDLVLLMELVDPKEDGTPFTVNLYWGSIVQPKDMCDYQVSECTYNVSSSSLDPSTCVPLTSLTNARILDGKLIGGGGAFTFYLSMEIAPGVGISIPISLVQLKGDVVKDDGKIHIENGVFGGAVLKDVVIEALASLPADLLGGLPPEIVTALLEEFFTSDLDLNGDGSADAASLGLKFRSIPGLIVGLDVAGGAKCSPEGHCVLE